MMLSVICTECKYFEDKENGYHLPVAVRQFLKETTCHIKVTAPKLIYITE
jgi:hypothetical protein